MIYNYILHKYEFLNRERMEAGLQNTKIQKWKYSLTHRFNNDLRKYFERNDISCLTSGVGIIVTRKKRKKKLETVWK